MARELKGLKDVIGVTIVNPPAHRPGLGVGGYPGVEEDTLNRAL